MADFLIDGPQKAETCVILVHGSGAPMDTPFMAFFAEGLARHGILVLRFEFPYMARRRQEGGKRPPDRTPLLLDTWRAVIDEVRHRFASARLFIGGKSMGGRMASLIAEEADVDGIIGLGFPFYPTGKPGWSEARLSHMRDLRVPALICQGERDALGCRTEVEPMPLAETIRFVWLPDGDHSLRPRKASGRTEQGNLDSALEAVLEFVKQ